MDWIKIKVRDVLNSGLSDEEIGRLVKIQALVAQKERVPNDHELSKIMRLSSINKLAQKLDILGENINSIIEKVLEDVIKASQKKENATNRVRNFRGKSVLIGDRNAVETPKNGDRNDIETPFNPRSTAVLSQKTDVETPKNGDRNAVETPKNGENSAVSNTNFEAKSSKCNALQERYTDIDVTPQCNAYVTPLDKIREDKIRKASSKDQDKKTAAAFFENSQNKNTFATIGDILQDEPEDEPEDEPHEDISQDFSKLAILNQIVELRKRQKLEKGEAIKNVSALRAKLQQIAESDPTQWEVWKEELLQSKKSDEEDRLKMQKLKEIREIEKIHEQQTHEFHDFVKKFKKVFDFDIENSVKSVIMAEAMDEVTKINGKPVIPHLDQIIAKKTAEYLKTKGDKREINETFELEDIEFE